MKRFLAIFAIVMIAVLLSVPMTVSAAEAVTEVATEDVDVLYRVKEFIANNSNTLGAICGFVGAVITVLAYVRKFKNNITALVKGGSDEVKESQGNVVLAMNTMITEYNAMMKQNEEMFKLMQKFFATASAVELESKTVLEILERVYVNSKNLPSGVKDVVTQLYANCKLTADGLSEQVSELREQMLITDGEGVDVA
jgi:hypothetical protein